MFTQISDMKYTVDIHSWNGAYSIPYSQNLENAIAKVVQEWINENIEYPGNWVTYIGAIDNNGVPCNSGLRIN